MHQQRVLSDWRFMPTRSQATPADLLGAVNDLEAKNAPDTLYYEGDTDLLRSWPRVSVIGTRKPSSDGQKRAQAISTILAERKVVVVSGLAAGIDTMAHQAAIEAGGRTIAVLGTPLEQCSPKSNEPLLAQIKREHLAVSQFPPGTVVQPSSFPRRNRTMALLSHATVIVEAGDGSGTLHQGWEALRLGRPLFLMASLLSSEDLKWPTEMVGYGARSLTRDGIEELFEVIPEGHLGAELPF